MVHLQINVQLAIQDFTLMVHLALRAIPHVGLVVAPILINAILVTMDIS